MYIIQMKYGGGKAVPWYVPHLYAQDVLNIKRSGRNKTTYMTIIRLWSSSFSYPVTGAT